MAGVEDLLVEGLNRAIRTVLSVDPESVEALAALTGKVYCITLTAPAVTLYLEPDPDGFSLTTQASREPDVTLTGSISAFAKLGGIGSDDSSTNRLFSDGQITMQGDAEAGQQLQRALAQFDLDWEELIARVIGDTPARKVGNAIRDFGQWAEQTAKHSRSNLSDYLTEERQVMASEAAMRRLENGVNTVRENTDRLASRIERLRRQLGQ